MQPTREGESSKKAEKRFKRQQEAAIAASLQQGYAGIRISSGDSTSLPHVSPHRGVDEAPQVQKKKTRGPSKLIIDPEGTIEQNHIQWNEFGQPVGCLSAKFSTDWEAFVKERFPLSLGKKRVRHLRQ